MSQINDQNILLRAQLTASGSVQTQQSTTMNGFSDQHANRMYELEQQVFALNQERSHNERKISFYESENARLLTEIEQFKTIKEDESATARLNGEIGELKSKILKMNKDQEDLLELLADQDGKIREYKKRLRNLGEQVSDDEED